jgi:hypothetical protein
VNVDHVYMLVYRLCDHTTHKKPERECELGLTVHEAHGAVAVLSRVVQSLQM